MKARPLAMVLPEDVVTHATVIAATLCASTAPTYIRPEDWREIDSLVDWLIEKNKSGYQMVNSVQRLQEIKAFVRMSSGLDLKQYGWNGDGSMGSGHEARD